MDIARRIREVQDLTPTELQLAHTVLELGERLQGLSIKELARHSSTSIASIHRLCKKLGLEGFKELKIEMARSVALRTARPLRSVDINFPFSAGDRARDVVPTMSTLYETTVRDTVDLIDLAQLDRAARLIDGASRVTLYTGSHNLYPAQMFEERLLSAGKEALCPVSRERSLRIALSSGPGDVAIHISYSGLGVEPSIMEILTERKVPSILIGSQRAKRVRPGMDVYLMVSDREDLQSRITQFASHIAVQFVLDALYGCVFSRDYDNRLEFLSKSIPYTGRHLPASGAQARGGKGASASEQMVATFERLQQFR